MNRPDKKSDTQRVFSREELHERHRLTHRQIDNWLGEPKAVANQQEVISQLNKVAQFIKLTDCFKHKKIPFISFKGPLLSHKIYGDATYRYFKDFDFLVQPQHLTNMIEVLKGIGFQIENLNFPKQACKRQLWMQHENHVGLYQTSTHIVIELHWSLFTVDFLPKNKMQDLIAEQTTSMPFQNREFQVFSHEFELLYLIIHGAKHHWGRLKWLVDIKELLQRYSLNEDKFLDLASTMKANQLVMLCNALLDIYSLDAKRLPHTGKTPKKIVDQAIYTIHAKDMFEMNSIAEYTAFYWNFSKLIPGLSYKRNIIKKLLFASDLAMKSWMPCSKYLNYILGPFWKLSRGIRH